MAQKKTMNPFGGPAFTLANNRSTLGGIAMSRQDDYYDDEEFEEDDLLDDEYG